MIEGLHTQGSLATEVFASLSANDSATILGLAAVAGFGVLAATLFFSTFRHKPQRDSDNPLDWPVGRARLTQRSERINPGNLSSWKRIENVPLPKGPKLN